MKRLRFFLVNAARKVRYMMIGALVGDMPVMMNCGVTRPPGYKGPLYALPDDGPALFDRNNTVVWRGRAHALIVPLRNAMVKK